MTTRLEAIGLVAGDMSRSLAFYRELGLEFPDDADTQPHVETTLPGGLRLMWDTVETIHSFQPEWQPPSGGPGFGLAFACEGPAEVDATYGRMTSLGYEGHKAPFDAPWGQRYASLRDPDGHGVDLFSPS